MTYDQMRLDYLDPQKHTWQLQGPDQNAHPAVLLRKPMGLQGVPISVERRKVLRSRDSFRVDTTIESREIEMTVEIAANAPSEMYTLLQRWHDAWPENDEEPYADEAPTFGTLVSTAPGGQVRKLDVYRTEAMETLSPLDPLVALKARYLIVCSSDDPYPYGDTVRGSGTLAAGKDTVFTLTNNGEVPVSPKLTIDAGVSDVTVSARASLGGATKTLTQFSMAMKARGTFDLDPNVMTFTYEGDVFPMTYWWKLRPVGERIEAGTVKPIAPPWGQNADLVLPPGKAVDITVKSSKAGSYKWEFTPRYRRFMF